MEQQEFQKRLEELGRLKKDLGVPFLVVDAVASAGGAPVLADAWHADCVLGGSQKCLACPPDMSFMSVSAAACVSHKEKAFMQPPFDDQPLHGAPASPRG